MWEKILRQARRMENALLSYFFIHISQLIIIYVLFCDVQPLVVLFCHTDEICCLRVGIILIASSTFYKFAKYTVLTQLIFLYYSFKDKFTSLNLSLQHIVVARCFVNTAVQVLSNSCDCCE